MNERYLCGDCGYVFDVPKRIRESYEYWGGIYYDHYDVCPICKGWCILPYSDNIDDGGYKPPSSDDEVDLEC